MKSRLCGLCLAIGIGGAEDQVPFVREDERRQTTRPDPGNLQRLDKLFRRAFRATLTMET